MIKRIFSTIILLSLGTAEAQTSGINLPSKTSRPASDGYRSCSSQEDYVDYLNYFLQKNQTAKKKSTLSVLQKLAHSMSFQCRRQFPLFKKTVVTLERWGLPEFAVEKVALDLFKQKIRSPQKLEEVLSTNIPEELKKLSIGVTADLLAVFTKEPLASNSGNFSKYLYHGAEYMNLCMREIYRGSADSCRRSLPDIFSEYALYTNVDIPTMARKISASYDSLYNDKLPSSLKDKGRIVSNILKLGPAAGDAFINAVHNERMRNLHKDNPDIFLESAILLSLKGFTWGDRD